jgi:anthranilate phosphoribosyltransferase
MHDVVARLVGPAPEVGIEDWRSLWDELDAGRLDRADGVALLASLATRLPGHDTLHALLASFDERRPGCPVAVPGAVNVVGTGGGPPTFNVSTAAAFVAAATGVPVVKTGSRAYASALGSVDLLERLGVRLTRSHEETAEALATHGLAFAGPYAYPRELARLARLIVPTGMRPFGRALNALGPFLAAVPVPAQVTGVSDRTLLPTLTRLAATVEGRSVWVCANDAGVDELVGFATNLVATGSERGDVVLAPGRYTTGRGGLDDLRPPPGADPAAFFLGALAGEAGEVATDTLCLNAAALAMAGGHAADWADAVAAARAAVHDGAARALADALGRAALATPGGVRG